MRYLLIVLLLFCISCTTLEERYESRYERATDFFGIDVVKPRLIWVGEELYTDLLFQYNLTYSKVGFYGRDTIYIRECHKTSPNLMAYLDHELAHHFFYELSNRTANEFFAVMYEELNNKK